MMCNLRVAWHLAGACHGRGQRGRSHQRRRRGVRHGRSESSDAPKCAEGREVEDLKDGEVVEVGCGELDEVL